MPCALLKFRTLSPMPFVSQCAQRKLRYNFSKAERTRTDVSSAGDGNDTAAAMPPKWKGR